MRPLATPSVVESVLDSPAPPIKVLVVEDREEDFHYISMLLMRRPSVRAYEVRWAASYDEGLEQALSNRYDVGLVDYQLGSGTGLDLLRMAQARRCEMPVILLTGYDSAEIDYQASQEGAADYLSKVELTTTQLERAIRYACRHALMLSELRRTTSLLNGILSSLPVIATRVDEAGVVQELLGHGLKHVGLDEAEFLGVNMAVADPLVAEHIRRAIAGGEANFIWEISRQGKTHYFESYFRFDSERGQGAIGFSVNVTARIEAETERRHLEQQLLTASEAEQQRIGADLHDGLGQHLTGLAFMATALRDRLRGSHPSEATQAELITRLANEATEQSLALARGLCPVQIEQRGLRSALEDLTTQARWLHRVECQFSITGEPLEVAPLTATHLYRITQEAIHNAVRHGAARIIRIALVSNPQMHQLVVSDNGCGFDPNANGQVGSRGLKLMTYRATMIGATLIIDSKPGKGTRITCRWPTSSVPK